MKKLISGCAILITLTACVGAYDAGPVRPIPGSITYGGHQPRTKLTKAPIGSTFTNQIIDEYGMMAIETYRIEPDRSLTLIRRDRKWDFFDFD